MKKLVFILLLISFSHNLIAQEAFTIAVITQNTYLKTQNWISDTTFPDKYIIKNAKNEFYITDIHVYNKFWTVTVSLSGVIKDQIFQFSKEFPEKEPKRD